MTFQKIAIQGVESVLHHKAHSNPMQWRQQCQQAVPWLLHHRLVNILAAVWDDLGSPHQCIVVRYGVQLSVDFLNQLARACPTPHQPWSEEIVAAVAGNNIEAVEVMAQNADLRYEQSKALQTAVLNNHWKMAGMLAPVSDTAAASAALRELGHTHAAQAVEQLLISDMFEHSTAELAQLVAEELNDSGVQEALADDKHDDKW